MAANRPFSLKVEATKAMRNEVKRVDRLADRGVKTAIRKAVVRTTKPLRYKIRDAAKSELPKRGGLNTWAARVPSAKTRFSRRMSGVSVVMRRKGADVAALNRGRARHPVYGNKKVWATTEFKPGFFSETAKREAPGIVRDLDDAIYKAAIEGMKK